MNHEKQAETAVFNYHSLLQFQEHSGVEPPNNTGPVNFFNEIGMIVSNGFWNKVIDKVITFHFRFPLLYVYKR